MFSKLSTEFIGTFWLVLGGCGSGVLAAAFPAVGVGLLGVSLAFGLTVLARSSRIRPPRNRPHPHTDPFDQHLGDEHVAESGRAARAPK